MEEFSPTIRFTAVSVPNPHLIGIVGEYYIKHHSHQFLLAHYLNHDNEYCADGVNVSYVYPMGRTPFMFERMSEVLVLQMHAVLL